MSSTEQQLAQWFTAIELAAACNCRPEQIEALARINHWPRVHGPEGAKYPIKPEVFRRALEGNPRRVHGSVPLR